MRWGSIVVVLVMVGACGHQQPGSEQPPPPPPGADAGVVAVPDAAIDAAPVIDAAPAIDAPPPLVGDYQVSVGSGPAEGKRKARQAWVTAQVPCPGAPCERPPVAVGPGRVTAETLIDLEGPSRRLRHQNSFGNRPGSKPKPTLPATAKFPVLVLLVDDAPSGGATVQRMVVVSLRGNQPTVILTVELSSHRPGGGGFSTINDIAFERVPDDPVLAIGFAQTSTPRKGDRPFRPGPPLRRTYRFDGTRYQPAR